MKNPGPFGKAFAIAALLFILNLVIASGRINDAISSYESGKVIGELMAPHIMAAIATGAIAKFALKKTKWLTILGIYIPACSFLIGVSVLGSAS